MGYARVPGPSLKKLLMLQMNAHSDCLVMGCVFLFGLRVVFASRDHIDSQEWGRDNFDYT